MALGRHGSRCRPTASALAVGAIFLALDTRPAIGGAAVLPVPLTLDQALLVARDRNAELGAARTALGIARAAIVAAGAYPNPEVSVEGGPSVPDASDYEVKVNLDQPISILGKIPKRTALAEQELEREQWLVKDLERRIDTRLRAAYRQAQVADRRMRVSERLAELNERLLAVARPRFARGEVSELDVRQFETELVQRRQEVAQIGATRRSALIELSRLLNVPAGEPIELAPNLAGRSEPFPLDPLLAATRGRPDLRALQSEAEAGAREKELRTAERWGNPVVGLFYRGDRSQFDSPQVLVDRDQFLGARIAIPLPLLYQNQGAIAAAESRRRTAQAQEQALDVAVDREVRDAHQRAITQLGVIQGFDGGIAVAEQAVKLGERAYRDGLISAVQLVQTQQQLFSIMAAKVGAQEAYYQALSELEGAVNGSIEQILAAGPEVTP